MIEAQKIFEPSRIFIPSSSLLIYILPFFARNLTCVKHKIVRVSVCFKVVGTGEKLKINKSGLCSGNQIENANRGTE